MPHLRSVFLFGVATSVLFAAACSFQDFDYLKDSYHPAGGGGVSSAAGGKSGSDSEAGESNAGNSSAGVGNSDAGNSGAGRAGVGGQGETSSGGTSSGGRPSTDAAGEGGTMSEEPGMLLNASFELGSGTNISSWTSEGTAGAATVVFQEARSGSGRLGHWLNATAYKVSTWQVVQPLPNGNYTFEIWVKRSQYLTKEYIFARDYSRAEPAAEKTVDTAVGDPNAQEAGYLKISILHIPITSGKVKLGIYTEAAATDNWSVIDDASLTLEP
jgi:hypothetical protein